MRLGPFLTSTRDLVALGTPPLLTAGANLGGPNGTRGSFRLCPALFLLGIAGAMARERMNCDAIRTTDELSSGFARQALTCDTAANALPQRQKPLGGGQAVGRCSTRPLGARSCCAKSDAVNAHALLLARPKHHAVPSNCIRSMPTDTGVFRDAGSLFLASTLRRLNGPRRAGVPSNYRSRGGAVGPARVGAARGARGPTPVLARAAQCQSSTARRAAARQAPQQLRARENLLSAAADLRAAVNLDLSESRRRRRRASAHVPVARGRVASSMMVRRVRRARKK